MRLALRLTLFAFLISSLLVSAAGIPGNRRYDHGAIANIQARATDTEATTAVATTKEAAPATEASTTGGTQTSATSEATAIGNGTSTTQAHTQTSTTALALATPTGFQNGTNATENALPLQPTVTPALGVGGFILLATGAILALIGIRNLWVQVFLSTAFLTSLGVTVLIVYVMNPPVSVAVEGAYLVAVFFTGVTFGALSIVFKELTEGLGCLLGGFCLSMWLLALKPGGLLTDTNSKSGFIGAISVGIYALSFSHYTRPYALIGSTAASGGTAVALGIDCFSRAGLKEFWLYIWALNEDIFPLNTNTYPVTRNIRVELAATVIVAILGVISQLRLWNVVRERRRKEEELRAEEQRKKDEAEAEMGRRLEENNEKERLAWEARYGNGSGPDIPELGTNSKTCLADEKADFKKDMDSMATSSSGESSSSSERSYRCEDCLEREENGESLYARSVVSDSSDDSQDEQEEGETEVVEKKIPKKKSSKKKRKSPPLKVFDGAAATRMKNDNNSEVTAIVGSETGTIRSKRFSGQSMIDRMSMTSSTRQMSDSQEALVSCGDAASYMQDDDDDSDAHSDGGKTHKMAGSVHGDSDTEDVSKPKKTLESTSEDTVTKNADAPSVYSREVEDVKDVKTAKPDDASAKEDGARSSSTTLKDSTIAKNDKEEKTEKPKHLEAVTDASPSKDKTEEVEGSEHSGAAVDKTHLEDKAKHAVKSSKKHKSSIKENEPEEVVKESTKSSKIISMIKKYEPPVEENAEETVKKVKSSKSSNSKKPASKTSGGDLREEATEADAPIKKPTPAVKDAEPTKPKEQTSPTADVVVNPSTSDGSTIRSSSSAQQSQESSDVEDIPPKVKESHKRKASSRSKTKSKPKKEEPAKLDARHVKQLPQRDSIVVQSYRTNEWAKHLADAEVLEPEPIEPVEEEVVEYTMEEEQPAAPVNVEELLQTPLNAQPPPAVERHASISKSTHTNENHRKSEDSQSRRNSQSTKRGSRSKRTSGLSSMSPADSPQPLSLETHITPAQVSMSGAFTPSSPLPPIADAVEQPREEAEPPKAQWVGPPPLIAVREGMMQNKLSSFSPSTEPWSRNSPGLPISTRSSPVQSTFPTLEDPDNMPLSRRRTMLHQQTMRSSPTNVNPPSAVRWSQGSAAPMAGPAPAVTAPRRASVRENGFNHNASRTSLSRHNSVGTHGPPLGQGQWSTSSINLDQAIAQGMQRGDMSNLHRDVMRRMQAKANQQVNGT